MDSKTKFDIVIIGGGLAGLVAALHLSSSDLNIVLFEKSSYPRHKVCGEYISNEVLPYLNSLGFDPAELGAQNINRFLLSSMRNRTIEAELPLGGFGISRYQLDAALAAKAKKAGVKILKDTITGLKFKNDQFEISRKKGGSIFSKIAIGAYGKRDGLDQELKRGFAGSRSPYLAVKMHLKGRFSNGLVALHNFKGGYCGVSKVENGIINLCYLTNYNSFKEYKNIANFQEEILYQNKFLKEIFENTEPLFENPLSISQISFERKKPIENHLLMCGDSAGMIHPLCGNGMGMAIRSSQIASGLILDYFKGEIKTRSHLENIYLREWNSEFRTRLRIGHLIASVFRTGYLTEFSLLALKNFPGLLPKIIKMTHGKIYSS